jgi:hypothetical protein
MRAMHRWLLVLMIALLPLRGWVGDAMAGEMLRHHVAAAAVQAEQAPAADCMGHHGVAAPAAAGHTASVDGDGPTCASCQVCSAVALAFTAPAQVSGYSQPRPQTLERAHRNADRAQAFKPPIS